MEIALSTYWKGRLFKPAYWVLFDQLLFSGGSFLTTILLARNLNMGSFGTYASVTLVLFLLLGASNALIISPFQVRIARDTNAHRYISVLFIGQVTLTMLLLIIGGLVLWSTPLIMLSIPALLLWSAGFLLHDFFRRVLLTRGQTKKALALDGLTNVVQIVWLAALAASNRLTLSGAVWVIGITYVPALLLGVYFIKPKLYPRRFIYYYLAVHWKVGSWLLLSAGVQWWANNLLVLASGVLMGLEALGALRLAQTLFGVLNVVLQVYENDVLPRAARYYQQSAGQMKVYLNKVTRNSLMILLPTAMVLWLAASPIMQLSGGDAYVPYAYTIKGMVLLYLLIFIGYPVRITIRIKELNKSILMAYLLVLVFNLLLAGWLIQNWSVLGVIAGLILNQLLVLGYWLWRLAGAPYRQTYSYE